MKIVKFIGGLGNQLFQYAFYSALKHNGINVKADISSFERYNVHNGFELEQCFNIDLDIATIDEINLVTNVSPSIFSRIKRKFNIYKSTHVWEKATSYSEVKSSQESLYLEGYWQSMKGYEKSLSGLANSITFNIHQMQVKNVNVLNLITNGVSIAIHLRRGDYLSKKNISVFEQCSITYYKRAIRHLNNKFEGKKISYFIFSDDIQYAKKIFADLGEACFIDWNKGEDSYMDMFLMSQCNGLVIPNSTFSWWAGVLGVEKHVVAPKYWWQEGVTENSIYLPSEWEIVDNRLFN